MPRLLLAALAMLFAAGAVAQTYRWVDKDGKVNYSDTPPPPAAAKSVQKRSGGGNVVESGQTPYATQQAIRTAPVTIYTAETCKQICDDARKLLQARGVPFREIAVADEASRDELKRVSGGQEVPVMVVGKSVTSGFGADSWNMALDAAGYPKSGPPVTAQAQKPPAPAAKAQPPEQADESPKAGPYAPK
jgi:glutaredoxin